MNSFKVSFYFSALFLVIVSVSCQFKSNNECTDSNYFQNDSITNEILVVSHRGDWRNAPENSLQAIENCIKMGVDMVEIDIRSTQDEHLVLMHDNTIDRTTSGSGKVKKWTLDSLKKVHLKDGIGNWTNYHPPTLKEALEISKDKILVNLDIKDYSNLKLIYDLIEETNTHSQVIFKFKGSLSDAKLIFGVNMASLNFMPIVSLDEPNYKEIINEYLNSAIRPFAFELIFDSNDAKRIEAMDLIKKAGSRIWVNALWANMCGGYNDEKAALDPNIYQWYLDNNIDMIQTDRPELLLNFLKKKEVHK